MNRILMLFLILISFHANSQSYSPFVNDSDVYKFMNWEISNSPRNDDDKKKVKQINSRIADWFGTPIFTLDSAYIKQIVHVHFYEQCKEYFSDKDFEYIENHFYRTISTVSTKGIVVKWKNDFENAKKTEKLKNYQFYNYTVPLFTRGEAYVLIQKNFLCGMTCESSCIYLYKNMGNNYWVLVKKFECWIS
ncbi:MAG: hypothetical protein K9J13_10815 [Saprospiraceae bacterium]|nr:hypothetical protein [Saprospiraceae bacterium]